jgi:hypothetical protein
MDKTFIMKLTNTDDLLGKDSAILGVQFHPVPFPNHTSVLIQKESATETILEHVRKYRDRTFYFMPENYGLVVSINYENGKLRSMILKGTGEQGERIADNIATMLMPKESHSTQRITFHAIISITDVAHTDKVKVPWILKQKIRNGDAGCADEEIVCRPFRFYVDDVQKEIDDHWDLFDYTVIAAYSLECGYAKLRRELESDLVVNKGYRLPQRGVVIMDQHPEEEGAFPETHFLFSEDDVIIT